MKLQKHIYADGMHFCQARKTFFLSKNMFLVVLTKAKKRVVSLFLDFVLLSQIFVNIIIFRPFIIQKSDVIQKNDKRNEPAPAR